MSVPMILYCPSGHQHIDEGEWATREHRTHQCQYQAYLQEHGYKKCGLEWRPSHLPTVGVKELP